MTVTLSIPDEHDERLAAAISDKRMLGRPATKHDLQAELAEYLRTMVRNYEKRKAAQALPEPDELEMSAS